MGELPIKPPDQFSHAGVLSAKWDTMDPRKTNFECEVVEIDLKDCAFVQPAASLWCVVYLALARRRGSACTLLLPSNTLVCAYLKLLGVLDYLKDIGVSVDDRDIWSGRGRKTVLPITPFKSAADAEDVANKAFAALQSSGYGAANLTDVIVGSFGELATNAAQHSESEIGAFACIHFIEPKDSPPRFSCIVADGGIGVYASMRRNPALRTRIHYDWDALELAVRERVSGTGDPNRGIGLYGVSEDQRSPGRSLLLHSGLGSLEISEELESSARRTRLFPGTLAYLSIPT